MSNFFKDVLGDLDGLEQDLLGPDYSYYKQIKSPEEIGMSSDGNLGAMESDIAGLMAYTEVLVEGGGTASKVNRALGDKFFLLTGAKCKDTKTNNQVKRSLYINNVPDGNIPFISSGLGTNFTEFEGLLPGTMSNLANINPLEIFQAFMSGTNPDCTATTLETIDTKNNVSTGTGYITTSDIKGMEPCWFPDNINPITKVAGSGCDKKLPTVSANSNKCNTKLGYPSSFENACKALKLSSDCNNSPSCVWGDNGAKTFPKSDITITGNSGITIGINKDIATGQHGQDQSQTGCWSFNTIGEPFGGDWGAALKNGDSCSAATISLPDGIEAYAYTSGGGWDNLCSQQFIGYIASGAKNVSLKRMNPCGFVFKEKTDFSKIQIIGTNGKSIELDPSQVTDGPGPGQGKKGCWSLDTNSTWQQALKWGNSCAVAYISLPKNIQATAYTSSGGWGNLCSQQNLGIIPAGTQGHYFPVSPCGFLFSTSNEGFENLSNFSSTTEISTIIAYLYFISLIIFFGYIFTRKKK